MTGVLRMCCGTELKYVRNANYSKHFRRAQATFQNALTVALAGKQEDFVLYRFSAKDDPERFGRRIIL